MNKFRLGAVDGGEETEEKEMRKTEEGPSKKVDDT